MVDENHIVCSNLSESNWDEGGWPITTLANDRKVSATKAKERYFLHGHLLQGLDYSEKLVYGGYISHQFSEREVERRAWEVYGGPNGLKARVIQINKKIRAKWLRGEAATKHVNSRQPTESKLSTSQTGKTKSLDLGTIEISSESGDDFESLEPASVDPLPSSALVVSSPTRIQKGKKCSRDLQDVLELSSSDEGDELPKKKIRCSSVIILDD